MLQKNPELAQAGQKVLKSTDLVALDSLKTYQLHSIGLVKIHGNQVLPRCQLCREYLSRALGD
jgi:hypothetical protein